MPRRPSTPWKLRKQSRSQNYFVRFTHQGGDFEKTTGTSDPQQAKALAQGIYAKVVNGDFEHRPKFRKTAETTPEELLAVHLTDLDRSRDPFLIYARHWARSFATLEALCGDGAILSYWRERLGNATWPTVNKERGPLKDFLDWCEERAILVHGPAVPALPKQRLYPGKPHDKRRRGEVLRLTGEEARTLIDHLPKYSASKRVVPFPIKARFVVMLELGLRNGTLDKLEVGRHYKKGAASLHITADIDKEDAERTLPLSPLAMQALESVCPAAGLIFGRHDYRPQLKKAAELALTPERAEQFFSYAFRHRAAVELVREDLVGGQFVLGHSQLKTTSRYARMNEQSDAAESALLKRHARYSRVVPPGSAQIRPNKMRRAHLAAGSKGLESEGFLTCAKKRTRGRAKRAPEPFEQYQPPTRKTQPSLREGAGFSEGRCAKKRTRTSTGITPLAPQRGQRLSRTMLSMS